MDGATTARGDGQKDPRGLYRIETNVGFTWGPVAASPEIETAAASFGLAPGGLVEVQKRNRGSRILRVAGPPETVLRRVPVEGAAAMEAQCAIVAALPEGAGMLRPLARSAPGEGAFVAAVGDGAWMAYRSLPGDTYAGQDPARVVGRACALLDALEAFEAPRGAATDRARGALPTAQHRPSRWEDFMRALVSGRALAELPPGTLADETVRALARTGDELVRLAARLAALDLGPGRRLVHNDLQHANVLVSGSDVSFLDLEDVGFEHRLVSRGHAVFKLLRHAVFLGVATPNAVRREMAPAAIAHAGCSRAELVDFGAYRIVSDVFEIAALALERGNPGALYDLEKKIHNLYELYELLGDDDGPRFA